MPLDLNFTNLESKLRNGKNQEEASDCAGDENGKKKKTRETTKTKMTLSTKRVFGVFCFQEQKTVLENIKQTGPTAHILGSIRPPHSFLEMFDRPIN